MASSHNSRVNFKARKIAIVLTQCPVHQELKLWIKLENRKCILVDVSLALQQWTRDFVSFLVEHIVTSRLAIDTDEWHRQIIDDSVHVCRERFD